jgi:hypothetical protein
MLNIMRAPPPEKLQKRTKKKEHRWTQVLSNIRDIAAVPLTIDKSFLTTAKKSIFTDKYHQQYLVLD